MKKPIALVGLDGPTNLADLLPKPEPERRVFMPLATSGLEHRIAADIIAAHERQRAHGSHVLLSGAGLVRGSETSMDCRCGGKLFTARPSRARTEAIASGLVDDEPKYRPFRFRGGRRMKWVDRSARRKYEAQRKTARFAVAVLEAGMFSRSFVCEKCGKPESMYSAIGRNMFKIEPLPPGALPIYDRDPDVAKVVTEGGDE